MYVIVGAAGNTGRIVANKLLDAGKSVRVIGRTVEKLQPFVERGAEAAAGSLNDAAFVREAFAGATAAYTMLPQNMQADDFLADQMEKIDALAAAVEHNRVTHVVNLSSDGAHLPTGTGPIRPLHRFESRLNQIEGLNVLHLRAVFFMENWLGNIGVIQTMGIHGTPLAPDAPLRVISVEDVGLAAAERLLSLDFEGRQVEILAGPQVVTMTEATRHLGEAIGQPDLAYVQFPAEDARQAMVKHGLSASMAAAFIEMFHFFNTRTLDPDEPLTRTATTVEQFAQKFAAAYQVNGA